MVCDPDVSFLVLPIRRTSRRSAGRLARGATAATVGLWLALLAGHAGTLWWPLDLFAHFRVQYAVLFLACCAILLHLRSWRVLAAAAVGAVVCAATVVVQTGASQRAVAASGERFRLVTYNAHRDNRSWASIADFLERSGADAVVLLEVSGAHVREIARRMPSSPHVYAPFAASHYHAALLSRWLIRDAHLLELTPGGSRALRARIAAHGRDIVIVGVHLHWPIGGRNAALRNAELARLAALAHSEPGPLLIGGDFNITPWSVHFQRTLGAASLEDCARGRGWLPTWPAFFPLLGIRIDHCLASAHWRVLDVRTGPSLGSDHYATVNDLEMR